MGRRVTAYRWNTHGRRQFRQKLPRRGKVRVPPQRRRNMLNRTLPIASPMQEEAQVVVGHGFAMDRVQMLEGFRQPAEVDQDVRQIVAV